MRTKRLACASVIALVLTTLVPSLVSAGGFVISEERDAYYRLIEDQQVVVIAIQPDRTAKVDLFVSFSDREGKADEVTYVLPLDSEPRGFSVTPESKRQFMAENTAALDAFVEKRNSWPGEFRQAMGLASLSGNLVVGQPLYVFAPLALVLGAGEETPFGPSMLESEHTRIEVLGVQSTHELDEALADSMLPEAVRSGARQLDGKTLELIKIKTTPVLKKNGLNSLGLHIGFTVDLKKTALGYQLEYPLGTARLWSSPIIYSKVYVSSPEGMESSLSFPMTAKEVGYQGLATALASISRGQSMADRIYVEDARDPQQTVNTVVYTMNEAAENLRVLVKESGPDSGFLTRETQSRLLFENGWMGFFGLAFLTWPALWIFAGGRLFQIDYRGTRLRAVIDSLAAFFIYGATTFAFAALAALPLLAWSKVWGSTDGALSRWIFGSPDNWANLSALAWVLISLAGFAVGAFAASQALRRWRGIHLSRRSVFVRFVALAALAAIVYNVTAWSIMVALWRVV